MLLLWLVVVIAVAVVEGSTQKNGEWELEETANETSENQHLSQCLDLGQFLSGLVASLFYICVAEYQRLDNL